jgi:hypothetical protein
LEVHHAVAEVTCDVACRLHAEPARLSSSYRAIADLLPGQGENTLRVASGSRSLEVRCLSSDEQACGLEIRAAGRLAIRGGSKSNQLPRTERWRYAISLC